MTGNWAARTSAAAALSALLLAACSSGHSGVRATGGSGPGVSTTASSSPGSTVAPSASTVAGQLPTVFDCGGGAYKPATLLVVCGVATTTATGVQWASWSGSGASGHGDVRLTGHQPAPAGLTLSKVIPTGNGPQFSQLTVTWTGASPDGHPVDVFQLATAPAQG